METPPCGRRTSGSVSRAATASKVPAISTVCSAAGGGSLRDQIGCSGQTGPKASRCFYDHAFVHFRAGPEAVAALHGAVSGRLAGLIGWELESESRAGTGSSPRAVPGSEQGHPGSRHASPSLTGAGERFQGRLEVGWGSAVGVKQNQHVVTEQRPRHRTPT